MRVYESRIYTLADRAARDFYRDVIYPRHVNAGSFDKHAIHAEGVWTTPDDDTRLFVLVSLPQGADSAEVEQRYISSPEFRADLEGFDRSNLTGVEKVTLNPVAISPLQ